MHCCDVLRICFYSLSCSIFAHFFTGYWISIFYSHSLISVCCRHSDESIKELVVRRWELFSEAACYFNYYSFIRCCCVLFVVSRSTLAILNRSHLRISFVQQTATTIWESNSLSCRTKAIILLNNSFYNHQYSMLFFCVYVWRAA